MFGKPLDGYNNEPFSQVILAIGKPATGHLMTVVSPATAA